MQCINQIVAARLRHCCIAETHWLICAQVAGARRFCGACMSEPGTAAAAIASNELAARVRRTVRRGGSSCAGATPTAGSPPPPRRVRSVDDTRLSTPVEARRRHLRKPPGPDLVAGTSSARALASGLSHVVMKDAARSPRALRASSPRAAPAWMGRFHPNARRRRRSTPLARRCGGARAGPGGGRRAECAAPAWSGCFQTHRRGRGRGGGRAQITQTRFMGSAPSTPSAAGGAPRRSKVVRTELTAVM